ncbi:hypothetical protein D5086_027828 [Populus alba]|uniref:Uncharacterized protein n=1 Tax=Populus alba TaxID=43335 RepID=A0ACC4AWF9_POPAL
MFSDKLALWMFWQFMGLVNLGGVFGCVISEGHWVFVGLPNAVKAWSTQVYALFVDSITHLSLSFFSVYAASPPPHPHLLFISDRVFQFNFRFVNQITGRENKQRVVERMMKFSLFFFQTKPTDDRGDDAPSRQKKNERRVPQRRKTTTEANITITNKRVSHRLDRRWPLSERHVKPASPPAESEGDRLTQPLISDGSNRGKDLSVLWALDLVTDFGGFDVSR